MNEHDAELFQPTPAMMCVHGLTQTKRESVPTLPQLDMIKLAQDLSYVTAQKTSKKTLLTTTQKKVRRILRDLKRVHQRSAARPADMLMEDTAQDEEHPDMDDETIPPVEEATAFMETLEETTTMAPDETTFAADVEDDDSVLSDGDHEGLPSRMTGPLTFKPCFQTLLGRQHGQDPVAETFDHLASELQHHGFRFDRAAHPAPQTKR